MTQLCQFWVGALCLDRNEAICDDGFEMYPRIHSRPLRFNQPGLSPRTSTRKFALLRLVMESWARFAMAPQDGYASSVARVGTRTRIRGFGASPDSPIGLIGSVRD